MKGFHASRLAGLVALSAVAAAAPCPRLHAVTTLTPYITQDQETTGATPLATSAGVPRPPRPA